MVATSTIVVYTEADHISPFPAMLTWPRGVPPLSTIPLGGQTYAIFLLILFGVHLLLACMLPLARLPRRPQADWAGRRMAGGRRQTGGDKGMWTKNKADEDSNVLIAVLPEIK